jgi:hypothetical protein
MTPGGVPYRITPQPRSPVEPKAVEDLAKIVSRLRLSVPLLRYAKADRSLRHLVLSTLMKMAADLGEVVAAPDGALIQGMSQDEFGHYRAALGGITGENEAWVNAELAKMNNQGR